MTERMDGRTMPENMRPEDRDRMDERRGSRSGSNRQNETITTGGQGSGTYRGGVPAMAAQTMPDTYREDYRDIYRGYRQDRMHKTEKNLFKLDKNYKTYNNSDEIFDAVIEHMTKGVKFHDKMMDLYGFLGLEGFKKMHEYQYYCESIERRKTKCYVLEHLNVLMEDKCDESGLNFIPTSWYEYTRHDITPDARKQYIAPSFEGYKQWEEETKDLLSYCANELMYMGQMSDFNVIMEMVEDVEKELSCIEDLVLKLKSVNFDMQYIMDCQEKLYEQYEDKLEDLFEDKIEGDKKKQKQHGRLSSGNMMQEQMYARRRSARTGRFI